MPRGVGANGKRSGRPPKELPGDGATIANAYDQLETMAGLGLTMPMMAAILGVSKDTLQERAKADPELSRRLEKGKAIAVANVSEGYYQEAVGVKDVDPETGKVRRYASGQPKYLVRPNIGAGIWLDKTRFGFRETVGVRDETPRRPGELPTIPLETLREATRAAEAAQKNGKVLKFGKRKEA
jgi:hypothetical protein